MKYYVVSDVHGFYSYMRAALKSAGFFEDTVPHKLIVCGDMFDRGWQARMMQKFMLELLHKDELIFVRGNHEDLLLELINCFDDYFDDIRGGYSHHIHNGTWSTALQLAGLSEEMALCDPEKFIQRVKASATFTELIPASRNYFETENHIFVHGWIPCITENLPAHYRRGRTYQFNPDWRNGTDKDWSLARWFNGMELAHFQKIIEPGKKIVCGHWHASYGHSVIEDSCVEFGIGANFDPFYGEGIIAIDACTAHTDRVNCIVIEE